MFATTDSAHRSREAVSCAQDSAHRSPSPWPNQLGIQETQSTPILALMPIWKRIERKWWDPRPRIMITIRARIKGGTRTYMFWRVRDAQARVARFLMAHQKVYHVYSGTTSWSAA